VQHCSGNGMTDYMDQVFGTSMNAMPLRMHYSVNLMNRFVDESREQIYEAMYDKTRYLVRVLPAYDTQDF
jgi:hypothetical protein